MCETSLEYYLRNIGLYGPTFLHVYTMHKIYPRTNIIKTNYNGLDPVHRYSYEAGRAN